MSYYDLAETEKILEDIYLIDLDRNFSLDDASILELQSQFNGAGSDAMPTILRKALSRLLKLKCTVAIHDWDYYKSDGTTQSQQEADLRFFTNGHKEIYHRFSWWNLYRYWSIYKLTVAYKLLQKYGEDAYKSSFERFNNQN